MPLTKAAPIRTATTALALSTTNWMAGGGERTEMATYMPDRTMKAANGSRIAAIVLTSKSAPPKMVTLRSSRKTSMLNNRAMAMAAATIPTLITRSTQVVFPPLNHWERACQTLVK